MREALYLVKFGDVAASGYPGGGVIVLVGDRLFGGDSGFYYRGTFSHEGNAVIATVEMTRHDPKWPSAFGDHPRALATKITGQVQGRDIVGRLERVGTRIMVPVALLWAADLPIRSPVVDSLRDRPAPTADRAPVFLITADGCERWVAS